MPCWKWGWTWVAGSAVLLAAVTLFSARPATSIQPEPAPAAIVAPNGMEARSTALIVTGSSGWDAELAARAARLSEMHTLVIGVDSTALLELAEGDCAATAPLLASLARQVQSRTGAMARTPVLTGYAEGAAIALSAADAAPDSFKGLVTVGFGSNQHPCPGTALEKARTGKAPLRWLDVSNADEPSVATGVAGATQVPAAPSPRRAFYQSYLRLAGTDHAFDTATAATGSGLEGLPLTLHQKASAPRTSTYAIFLSGDGGWANFDEQIADRLAARGIPVAGISTLRYMWNEKRPDQIASDLRRIDARFRKEFGRDRILLLGFSLGANTLPFAIAELPAELRSRIAGVGLIAPEARTGFEIAAGGWLGQQTGSVEVAPAINALSASLPPQKVLCLYGSKETVSACPSARLPGMKLLEMEGGHHLGKDYDGVAAALADLLTPDL